MRNLKTVTFLMIKHIINSKTLQAYKKNRILFFALLAYNDNRMYKRDKSIEHLAISYQARFRAKLWRLGAVNW